MIKALFFKTFYIKFLLKSKLSFLKIEIIQYLFKNWVYTVASKFCTKNVKDKMKLRILDIFFNSVSKVYFFNLL